jgi:IclR family transcriptional regulator, pca regulon regulatory protein
VSVPSDPRRITSRAVSSQFRSGAPAESAPVRAPGEGRASYERPRDFNQSLERGLEIIQTFGADAPRQTVSEVATKTGLTRATTRRFLITLVELGYVATDGRTFQLAPRVLGLGYSFLSGLGFPDVALPHLERLVAEVDESSEASVLDGEDIVYVVRVPGTKLMTIAINVGSRMPAHATSMGKVLLAGLSDTELEAYLETAALRRFLPKTVTDPAVLRSEILAARAEGFAIVDQELEEGLLAVAVAIHDRTGRVVAAVNLSTHIARRTVRSLREDLLPPLQRTARLIERDLAGAG